MSLYGCTCTVDERIFFFFGLTFDQKIVETLEKVSITGDSPKKQNCLRAAVADFICSCCTAVALMVAAVLALHGGC